MVGSRKLRGFSGNFPEGFVMPEIRIPDIPQIFTTLRTARLGVEIESLGPQLAEFFGVKDGVLVRAVLENTPAQKAGNQSRRRDHQSGRHAGDLAQRTVGGRPHCQRKEDVFGRARCAIANRRPLP